VTEDSSVNTDLLSRCTETRNTLESEESSKEIDIPLSVQINITDLLPYLPPQQSSLPPFSFAAPPKANLDKLSTTPRIPLFPALTWLGELE
jgi:hypothetical protein